MTNTKEHIPELTREYIKNLRMELEKFVSVL